MALQSQILLSNKCKFYWILQGDPHCTFVPASSNGEIEIALVPRRWLVSKKGTTPLGFCVRSDSDDNSRKNMEPRRRKNKKEALVVSGGVLDTEGLEEVVQ